MAHVSFGLHSSGRLIDAVGARNGLKCDCVCPGCRAPLVARQGQVKAPYFAHHDARDCPGGAMTALHLAAQQLIVQRGTMTLPPLTVLASRRHPKFGLFEKTSTFFTGKAWTFTGAQTEVPIQGGRVVDVAGEDHEMGFVAVEVRVHHEVDAAKSIDIEAAGVPCIEIDLRDLIGQLLTMESLAKHLFDRVDNKKWIFHPRKEQCRHELLEGYMPWVVQEEAALKDRDAEEAEWRRQELQRRQREQEEQRARSSQLEQVHQAVREQVSQSFGMPYERWPKPINFPDLNGKRPFLVDAPLWHGVLFDLCVLSRRRTRLAATPLPAAQWIASEVGRRLGCQEYLRGFDLREATSAVKAYLNCLKKFGYLEERSNELYLRSESDDSKEHRPVPVHTLAKEVVHDSDPWAAIWPTRPQMHVLAERFADRHDLAGFDAEYFVEELCTCDEEPTWVDLQRLMTICHGPVRLLKGLLDALCVRATSATIVCSGQPKPWDVTYR